MTVALEIQEQPMSAACLQLACRIEPRDGVSHVDFPSIEHVWSGKARDVCMNRPVG